MVLCSVIGDGIEVCDHAPFHLVSGMEFIAGEWPKALVSFSHICGGNGFPVLKHSRRTVAWGASKIMNKIEHM